MFVEHASSELTRESVRLLQLSSSSSTIVPTIKVRSVCTMTSILGSSQLAEGSTKRSGTPFAMNLMGAILQGQNR